MGVLSTSDHSGCQFFLTHRPNLRRLEIELTTRCNLMCRHCDRRCSQAPSEVDMELQTIKRFIEESLALDYCWEKIALLGGEPTLNPNLPEIIAILTEYCDRQGDCELFLVSNSCGRETKEVLRKLDPLIAIERRPKSPNEGWFTNMDIAPVDVAKSCSSCRITSTCGLGLTPFGYFPCGAGAAIARTLGWDSGIQSLAEVNEANMIELLQKLCKYCGHALKIEAGKDSSVSPFWRQATADYLSRHGLVGSEEF